MRLETLLATTITLAASLPMVQPALTPVIDPVAQDDVGASEDAGTDTGEETDSELAKQVPVEAPDPQWLDRLDATDRELLDANLGYAPPSLDIDGLTWFGSEPMTWDDLRDKVVVVQSWTTVTSPGRTAPARAQRAMRGVEGHDDVVLLSLHTPEGAADAPRFLERRQFDHPVILDQKGLFSDEFGFYRRPTNVVIDRNGVIRYAGLNQRGVREAVKMLLAEQRDSSVAASPRPAPVAAADEASEDVAFPEFSNTFTSARDLRGERAPEFVVERWLNGQPRPDGKVVVVDFWATWCAPCVRAIPHMNDLAAHFRNDVVCVGLSDEDASTVNAFMEDTTMRYFVAVDEQRRFSRGFGVRAIPHVAVISSDWVVRWQGHAAALDPATLQQIVEANRKLNAAGKGGTGPNRYRWSGGPDAI